MMLKALIGVSIFSVISSLGAFAMFKEAQVQRERAKLFQENNEVLRKDIQGHIKAQEAFNAALDTQNEAARVAREQLANARQLDETLDRCLAYDPGIDVTGLRGALEN